MDKSTKIFFFTVSPIWTWKIFCQSLRWWWRGGGVKNHPWTKNAGNFMKWINPLKIIFSLFRPSGLGKILSKFEVVVGGGVKNHIWTKNAGNFMKWINPLKKKIFFHCFAHLDLENVLSKFEVVVGGGWKSPLNQKCRKFHEMDKSTKNNFFIVSPIWTWKNFVKVWGGGGGRVKNHTWTKNAGNFMKWINPLPPPPQTLTRNFLSRSAKQWKKFF